MNCLKRIVSSQVCTTRMGNLMRIASASHSFDVKWKENVRKAEKIVGYPTSFMNLRWLLEDEVSTIASYISKLIGSKHPMVDVARNVIQQSDITKWGLIVLLVSKAAGIRPEISEIEQDALSGILHTQRSLAEITEMIKTGHQMHNTVMNVQQGDENYQSIHFGNKIALLSGDYLYSKSFKDLAVLNNNDLNEIIATSIRDLSEAEFLEPRDKYNRPLPSKMDWKKYTESIKSASDKEPYEVGRFLGIAEEEWMLRTLLGGVSLLAKACKGALMLGGHPEELQKRAFDLGRSIGLAWQLQEDIKPFEGENDLPFSLTNALVMMHLTDDPEMYELIQQPNCPYEEIRDLVRYGLAIDRALDLQSDLYTEAAQALKGFPTNEAHQCLLEMINTLTSSYDLPSN